MNDTSSVPSSEDCTSSVACQEAIPELDGHNCDTIGIDTEDNNSLPESSTFSASSLRNSWAGGSLRATMNKDAIVLPEVCDSFRPTRHSSSSTAAALFSSGNLVHGGGKGNLVDKQSVSSAEEVVIIDLEKKVEHLQEQMEHLVEKHGATNTRYNRVKEDNATLMARIHMLEEQVSEIRIRGEERLEEEMTRSKEELQRLKRENLLEIENYSIRMQNLGSHNNSLNTKIEDLTFLLENTRDSKNRMEKNLSETQMILIKEQREHLMHKVETTKKIDTFDERHGFQNLELSQNDSGMQLQECDEMGENLSRAKARIAELEMEMDLLRNKNLIIHESFEELQEKVLNRDLEEGRSLVMMSNQPLSSSLAAELEAMSEIELRKRMQEQTNLIMQLRNYIDGVLLSIMDRDPAILEVKRK